MEALCGVSTWEEHTGELKWEVLGRRGHSEAIFALAVPAWHRTVHRTVSYRIYGTSFQKYGKKRSYLTVPYYRTPYRTPYCNSPDDHTFV